MDRKNLFLGLACIAGAMALFFSSKPATHAPVSATTSASTPAVSANNATAVAPALKANHDIPVVAAQKTVLENKHLRVTFTSRGGAIEKVELLQQPADLTRKSTVVFNIGNADAAMALAVVNRATNQLEPVYSDFRLVEFTARSISYDGFLPDGSKVVRTFTLAEEKEGVEPYSIRFFTKVIPAAPGAIPARVWFSTGCWQHSQGDSIHQFLSVLADTGDELSHVNISAFKDSNGFLGLGAHKAEKEHSLVATSKPFNWVSSGNHFFASIIRVETTQRGNRAELLARPVKFNETDLGIQAFAYWEGVPASDLSVTTEGDFFVGPKEYARVSALPDGQVAVLQFSKILGFISFSAICKLLLACLGGVHALLEWTGTWSWGWAIVLLTILIKLITWPLTAAQQRSAKKMQQFAGPMKEIREKYKDNSEKLNKEMMKLYQEHKINPFAGCLPIFIQIPIFFGLYTAFQTTVELRLMPFLWIHDLASPDTLFHIGSFGFNLLPILMGITMWLSMRMTPMPSADDTQKIIMYTMAFLFPVICYALPAALSLYMTLQNLLQMAQIALTKDSTVVAEVPSTKKKKSKG